jgi:hypothetical protein
MFPLQQNIQLKFQGKIWSWLGNVLLMLSSWIQFSSLTTKVLNFNSVFVNINCIHKRHTHFKFVPSKPTDKNKEIILNHSKAVIMNFWTVTTTLHTSTHRHQAPTYTFKISTTFSIVYEKCIIWTEYKIELWNKQHSGENKTEVMQHVFKVQ